MLPLFLFILSVTLMTGASAQKVFAADSVLDSNSGSGAQYYDNSHRGDPMFRYLARRAMITMVPDFDFTTFRSRYTQTSQYDPIGDKVVDKMLELAYIVQNEREDQEKVVKAIEDYRNLVIDHMANLRVVLQALSLSKLDRRFGNPDFFKWMKEGLARSVIYSGDGKSRDGAYDAITLSEETVLFTHLGLKRLSTKSVEEDVRSFNIHEVQDLRTGQKWEMFVDITYPMSRMRHDKAQEKEQQFDLRRQ
ncbi:MAG: hypothetical protein KDJ75_10495 [Alphaproteobacteria bacterium]|nr:hypothetical protein [Alphaproteobacteria bacterium]